MNLQDAAKKLADADKAVRDEAMTAVLQAKDAAVPHLVAALGTPGAPVAKIALLLAALNSRDGLPRLYELLDKGLLDVDTRAVVARALGELLDGRDSFDDAAKRSVMRLSRDGHTTTRQLTVKALQQIGDKESLDRLREMSVADTDAPTKRAAGDAYNALKSALGDVEGGGVAVDLEAMVASASSGKVAVYDEPPTGPFASIVVKLRDPRWAIRNAAVEEAVQAGKPVVPALIDVLAGARASAKIGAAQALARIQAPEAAQALLDVVAAVPQTDDEKQLRPIALKALACSLTGGEEGMAQPLLPLTRDNDPFVRAGALLCLGRLADRIGARAATLALNDPHDHVKEAAAVALSEGTREEDQDLVLPLLAVLGGMPSPGVAVREAILLALARISVDDGATLLRLRHRVRPSLLGLTSSLRRTAIAILERCYTADDPPPLGVVDDVLGRLADDHPEVRLLAASFLATHLEPGMSGAVEKLEDALDKAERPVSLLVLEALKRHDTAKAKLALEACAEDADEAVAARAKELLEGFAPKTEEWTAAEVAAERAPVVEEAAAERAPPPIAAQVPKRVRPARASGGDVVEAKDPGSVSGSAAPQVDASSTLEVGSLKERLAAANALPEGQREEARARVLAQFAAAPSSSRLKDELAAIAELSDDEKRARREAILNRF